MSTISLSRRSGWIFPDTNINPLFSLIDNEWYSVRAIWYELNSSGVLVLRDNSSHGANMYFTAENAKRIRQNCTEAYVNVSCGNHAWMDALCGNSTKRTNAINTLIAFCEDNNFSGVDLDFEAFGSWSASEYTNYKTFLTELGNALHAKGFLLSVEAPGIWSDSTTTYSSSNEWTSRNSQGYWQFKYEDFNTLPVDTLVIMAYDYQWDLGAGAPCQPLGWLSDILKWARDKVNNKTKIIAGLPAHGYFGATGGYSLTNSNYKILTGKPGFATAGRDLASGELIWASSGISYVSVDDIALDMKVAVCEELGIYEHCLWYIGDNQAGSDKLRNHQLK